MTYFQAAIQVLRHADRPLTTREITEHAIEAGLISRTGKTPYDSIAAELYGHLCDGRVLTKLKLPSVGHEKRGSLRWTLRGEPS